MQAYEDIHGIKFHDIFRLTAYIDKEDGAVISETRFTIDMARFIWDHVYNSTDGPLSSIDCYGKFVHNGRLYSYWFNEGNQRHIAIHFHTSIVIDTNTP